MLIYLNGKFVPEEDAKVSVFDHGFLYGDGIYETLRAYDGKIFRCKEHIERLFQSARLIELNIKKTKKEIEDSLYASLNANNLKDAYIRLSITRGYGEIGLDPELCPVPTMIIIVKEFKGHPEELYKKGIEIAIVPIRRNHPEALNPRIKSNNFLNNILAKIEAKKRGAFEGIMLSHNGYVCEGTTSNMFMAKAGALITPTIDLGLLEGITRSVVIEVAGKMDIKVEEKVFTPAELYSADECFITSTTLEVMPVVKVDERLIGNGIPGGITKGLAQGFKDLVRAYKP